MPSHAGPHARPLVQGTQKAILYLMKVCGKVATVGNTGRPASSTVWLGATRGGPLAAAGSAVAAATAAAAWWC